MTQVRIAVFVVGMALFLPKGSFAQDNYTETILADEPVALYSFVSGAGATTVIDITGNGHDSKSMVGNVEIVDSGLVGAAALFSVDPNSNTGGSIVLDLQFNPLDPEGDGIGVGLGDFSLEALVSPFDAAQTNQVFMAQKDGAGLGRSNALISQNGFWGSYMGGGTTDSATAPEEDEWFHYVLSFDGDGGDDAVKFYINGELSGEPTMLRPEVDGKPESATGDWVLGSHKNESSQFFDGLLDEVAFYNYRLDDPDGDNDASDSLIPRHYNALLPDTTVSCDFNGDGICDLSDLNELQYSGLGSADLKYDLDGSGTVDSADTTTWLATAGSLDGDANLDGIVDAADLNAVGVNWQSIGVQSWAEGDFDGNGTVDATDLNSIGLNWQAGPIATAAVPEPNSSGLILLGLLLIRSKRR